MTDAYRLSLVPVAVPTNRPRVKLGNLLGPAGNAYAILGKCRAASRRVGWTDREWIAFDTEAKASNYENLLAVVRRHFNTETTT